MKSDSDMQHGKGLLHGHGVQVMIQNNKLTPELCSIKQFQAQQLSLPGTLVSY